MRTMGTIYVCDECGAKWIPEVDNPERCPSRKCRKRTWDKGGFRDVAKLVMSPTADMEVGGKAKWYPNERLAKLNAAKYGKKAK